MLIRVVSDLHLEFMRGDWAIPETKKDAETTLVLAGDIGIANKAYTYEPFINRVCEQFKHVIYIMGNHEHYHGKFPTSINKLNAIIKDEYLNVHVLEKDSIVIDGVAFVCATLWTNMSNHDALCIETCRLKMNDYDIIRTGPFGEPWKRRLQPIDTIKDFMNARHYIFKEIVKQKDAGNEVVVVTHHGPSFSSVPEKYIGDIVNGAYVSDLSEDILGLEDNQPVVWIHGHMHDNFDYMIGNTRVVCNPRGYDTSDKKNLNPDFDPFFAFDV